LFFVFAYLSSLQAQSTNTYTPSAENEAARKAFQDMKFGMFVHWGASSVLGAGEWVMHQRNIRVNDTGACCRSSIHRI
jgi:alpha-L-fucosidase